MIRDYFKQAINNINSYSDITHLLCTKITIFEFDKYSHIIDYINLYYYLNFYSNDTFYSYNFLTKKVTNSKTSIFVKNIINNYYFILTDNITSNTFVFISYNNYNENVFINHSWLKSKIALKDILYNLFSNNLCFNILNNNFTYIDNFCDIINSQELLLSLK